MTSPHNWEQACYEIDSKTEDLINRGIDAWEAAIKEEFDNYKHRYDFMEQKTIRDYYAYHAARQSQEKQQRRASPRPTPDQLWNAVFNLDVFGSYTEGNEFREMVGCGEFDLVPLGKVYGTDMLWLIPHLGSLPDTTIHSTGSHRGVAPTNCQAISYPDGHPSEGEITLVPSEDEDKLRRFVSLGWIVEGDEKVWHKTGHALVVNLEPGRERNPWIVLASTWPNDGQDTFDGDYMEFAPEVVDRDNDWTGGVLPGDKNRTPVGKIIPFNKKNIKGSILPHFGRDFKFNVMRKGSSRGYIPSKRGPGLADVMGWYWDPKADEEVCLTKDGHEYMRFSRETAKISYCKRATESFAGDEGTHGRIIDEHPFVPLEQRLASSHLGDSSQQQEVRSREVSSSAGF